MSRLSICFVLVAVSIQSTLFISWFFEWYRYIVLSVLSRVFRKWFSLFSVSSEKLICCNLSHRSSYVSLQMLHLSHVSFEFDVVCLTVDTDWERWDDSVRLYLLLLWGLSNCMLVFSDSREIALSVSAVIVYLSSAANCLIRAAR